MPFLTTRLMMKNAAIVKFFLYVVEVAQLTGKEPQRKRNLIIAAS